MKYLATEQEKSDQLLSQTNQISDSNKKLLLDSHQVNKSSINTSEIPTTLNSNLEKTRKDFSSLLILMRKASRLINVFDNKVKLVANKLPE